MNTAVSKTVKDRSAWFWLVFLVGAAIAAEISAVQSRDIGLAVSGIGFALMGAFSFLMPVPLTGNLREVFRSRGNVDPRVAALGGVGAMVCAVGVAVRWLW